MRDRIQAEIEESIATKKRVIASLVPRIETAVLWLIEALGNGKKLLLFGNGGSAADAQHIAAELIGQGKKQDKPLPAVALTTDTAILTAIANDHGFDRVFSRQVEALAAEGDVVLGISTTGNSQNVIQGLEAARRLGCRTIGLLGGDGGAAGQIVDLSIAVPSDSSKRIQESQMTIGHILCRLVSEGVCHGG